MKIILFLALTLCILAASDARLTIRHRRQVEREGSLGADSSAPASEVVVIKDTINPSLPGPLFLVPRFPGVGDAFDLDINEQDGTFSFGGRLPPHMHHFHAMQHQQSFGDIFDAIQRRFDEMTRNMMSFNNFGPGFNPTTDISSLPDDFNKTESEIVEMGGHRYVKKTTTLKKGGPGSSFFVRSTTFERVNDNENADGPNGEGEEDKKVRPVVPEGEAVQPEESQPGNSNSSVTPAEPAPVAPGSSSETPNNNENGDNNGNNGSSPPDVVPSSSVSSPAAAGESEGSPAVAEDANEREREGESVSTSSSSTTTSTTEQPSA